MSQGYRGKRLGRALGWFSIALGIPQLLAPERMNRFIGVDATSGANGVMRAVGLQELTVGAAILNTHKPAGWLWSRVAGDFLHLTLLAAALGSKRNEESRVGAAACAVAGVGLADLLAAIRLTRAADAPGTPGVTRLTTAVTVNQPPEEVYRHWRDLSQLPQFMHHLEAVQPAGDDRWHWVARAPAGTTVEWDAEIVQDRPGEVLAWRSVGNGAVTHNGSVRFSPAPGDRGTEVTVQMEYAPPGGRAGAAVATLFGERPEQQIRDDLRRFKQVVETGDVVRSDGAPEGATTARQLKQRPARPRD